MSNTSPTFLKTLYRLIEPDLNKSISMYDVGAAMDLTREKSEQVAQQLMADGLVDVRTLAGAIGITPAGLDLLEASSEETLANDVCLGTEGVVSSEAKDALEVFVGNLQDTATAWNLSEHDQKELSADIETLKAQLVSPTPKNPILRATAESLLTLLSNLDDDDQCLEKLSQLLA